MYIYPVSMAGKKKKKKKPYLKDSHMNLGILF